MIEQSLIFPESGEGVLLGKKKRGLGRGFFNGFGGHFEEGENAAQCAVRELREETGEGDSGIVVQPDDLIYIGDLTFVFTDGKRIHVTVFKVWIPPDAKVESTDEMEPMWWRRHGLPFDKMWPDDRYWLEAALNQGMFVEATFWFTVTGRIRNFDMRATVR